MGLGSFAAIAVAGFAEPLWAVPGTRASDAQVLGYVSEHRGGFVAALTLYAIGMGLFLAFASFLGSWVWRRGAPGGLVATFALGAASLATLVFAGFVPMLVLAYRAPAVDPGVARILYDGSFGLLALSGVPTAVALGAFAAIVFVHRVLPRLTAWAAALAAAEHVVIAGSFLPPRGPSRPRGS